MTKQERTNPDLLARSPSRKSRVAKGSGRSEKDVSKLISDFTRIRSMMQKMSQGGGMPAMPGMPGMGGMFGNAPQPGFRTSKKTKKKKSGKKKKGFGTL